MTCFKVRLTSGRLVGLTGERNGVVLAKGELDGVSLMPPQAGLIMRGLDGVSDISGEDVGGSAVDLETTCHRRVMADAIVEVPVRNVVEEASGT